MQKDKIRAPIPVGFEFWKCLFDFFIWPLNDSPSKANQNLKWELLMQMQFLRRTLKYEKMKKVKRGNGKNIWTLINASKI